MSQWNIPNSDSNDEPTKQEDQFTSLSYFISQWFFKPPLEALELAMSQYCAHYCLDEKPVWSFFLGPSSTGKTRIVLNPLATLPGVRMLDNINRNTFLSGWNKGGILTLLEENNGILIFSDFSTFLGLSDEERQTVQSQLRVLFDGRMSKDIGNLNTTWEGKVTILAACTPAIEKYWSVSKDLGERFISYKFPYEESYQDQMDRAKSSQKQLGKEKEIDERIAREVQQIVGDGGFSLTSTEIPDKYNDELIYTAIITAALRRTVDHTFLGGRREVTQVQPTEGTGRLVKALMQIILGNAILLHHPCPTSRGVDLAKKTALYTIPAWRYKVYMALLAAPDYTLRYGQLMKEIEIPKGSYDSTLDDLEAMNIIYTESSGAAKTIMLEPQIAKLGIDANIPSGLRRSSIFVKEIKEDPSKLSRLPNQGKAKRIFVDWKRDKVKVIDEVKDID